MLARPSVVAGERPEVGKTQTTNTKGWVRFVPSLLNRKVPAFATWNAVNELNGNVREQIIGTRREKFCTTVLLFSVPLCRAYRHILPLRCLHPTEMITTFLGHSLYLFNVRCSRCGFYTTSWYPDDTTRDGTALSLHRGSVPAARHHLGLAMVDRDDLVSSGPMASTWKTNYGQTIEP
jgi:hypothetical protein